MLSRSPSRSSSSRARGVRRRAAATGARRSRELRCDAPRARATARSSGAGCSTEMLAPGGDAEERRRALARSSLTTKRQGDCYGVARARRSYDEVARRARARPRDAYVAALAAARTSSDEPDRAARRRGSRRTISWRSAASVANLWEQTHRRRSSTLIASTRATSAGAPSPSSHEWSTAEALDKAEVTGDAYDALVTSRMGCATELAHRRPVRPRQRAADRRRAFAAERRRRGRRRWPRIRSRGTVPHVLKTRAAPLPDREHGEDGEDGVFYVETFFDDASAIAISSSPCRARVAVWVDDAPDRSSAISASGACGSASAARCASRQGPPPRRRARARRRRRRSACSTSTARAAQRRDRRRTRASRTALVAARRVLAESEPASTRSSRASPPRRTRHDAARRRALARARRAHRRAGRRRDACSSQPLVDAEGRRAGRASSMAAQYARADVAYPGARRGARTEKELYARAAAARSASSGTRAPGSSSTTPSSAASSRPSSRSASSPARSPSEPEVTEQLARVYGTLGWRAERMRAGQDLAERFPDDRDALALYLDALEEDGAARRGRQGRRAHQAARSRRRGRSRSRARAARLEGGDRRARRLEKRRPDRKEIAARIADVLARAGDPSAARRAAREGAREEPRGRRRRASASPIAPTRKGDTTALRRALAEALQAGAKGTEDPRGDRAPRGREPTSSRTARRPQGRSASSRPGRRPASTWTATPRASSTTRRLWVHPDGSSEMLEHEILRMQSQEAIDQGGRAEAAGGPRPPPARHQARRLDARARARRRQADADDAAPRGRRLRRDRAHHATAERRRPGQALPRPALVLPRGRQGLLAERVRRAHAEGQQRSRSRRVGNVPTPDDARDGHVRRAALARRREPARAEGARQRRTRASSCRACASAGASSLDDTLLRFVDAASDETPLDPRVVAMAQRSIKGVSPAPSKPGSSIARCSTPCRTVKRRTAAASSSARRARARRRSAISCGRSTSPSSSRS